MDKWIRDICDQRTGVLVGDMNVCLCACCCWLRTSMICSGMIHRLYDAMCNMVLKINGMAIVSYRKNGMNNFKLYIIMYNSTCVLQGKLSEKISSYT